METTTTTETLDTSDLESRVKEMYRALDEQGRSSVIKSLREGAADAADAVTGPSTRAQH